MYSEAEHEAERGPMLNVLFRMGSRVVFIQPTAATVLWQCRPVLPSAVVRCV